MVLRARRNTEPLARAAAIDRTISANRFCTGQSGTRTIFRAEILSPPETRATLARQLR
jgi:hypothetical protein